MASILSIEIDNHNIKLIEGIKKGNELYVYKTLSLDVPAYIDDGVITDIESLEKTIKDSLNKNNINSKKAILIINTNSIITRKLDLPYLNNNKEIKSMINIELEHLLAVDINEYVIIYKVSDIYVADGIKKAKYLVYGLPQKMYKQYNELSRKLKLQLLSLDLASNCLDKITSVKLVSNIIDFKKSTVSFINIGNHSVTFNVVRNGVNDFSRSITLTNDYSQSVKVAESLAEYNSKFSSPDSYINSWLDEISKYIRYYYTINKENTIEKIFLYGNVLGIESNLSYLSLVLNTEIEVIQGIADIVFPDDLNCSTVNLYFNGILSFYTVKNDINFVNDKHKHHLYRFAAFVMIIASVLIIFLMFLYSYIKIYLDNKGMENQLESMAMFLYNNENIELNKEIEAVKNEIEVLENYMNASIHINDSIMNENIVKSENFRKLLNSVPNDTKLKSVTISKLSIHIQCSSGSLDDISAFIHNLRDIHFIDDIYIPTVNYSSESKYYSYSLICSLRV